MKILVQLARHARRSVVKRGVLGTLVLAVAASGVLVQNLRPAHRHAQRLQRQAARDFDRKYNVDTAGIISQGSLDVHSRNQLFATRYEPIRDVDFAALLADTGLRYQDYTFIDLGSGKGRAILLAAALPFRRIVGVEFSPELDAVARDNLERYTGERNCTAIELACMDAARYDFPEDSPLVLYLYNPFERPVMQQVADNLAASFSRRPRRMLVLYFTPHCADVWDSLEFLQKKRATNLLCLYDSGDPPPAGPV